MGGTLINSSTVANTEQEKRGASPFLLIVLPLLGAGAYFGYRVAFQSDDVQQGSEAYNAFNVPDAPASEERQPASEQTSPVAAGQAAARPQKGGPGLAGFVPETSPLFTGKKGGKEAADPASKAEQEFIRKYDAAVLGYQERVLKPLSDKYYKKYAIVRQVDSAFARLGRLMDLRRQYEKDRNAYKWARGVASLPEVRKTALQFASKPEVWKVGTEMALEALRSPPPKPIQDEMKRFITSDDKMTEFVGDFSQQLIPHAGRMVSQAIPAGTDLTQLKDLAASLVPGAGAAAKGASLPQNNKQGKRP